jgi:hypothetical protein
VDDNAKHIHDLVVDDERVGTFEWRFVVATAEVERIDHRRAA